MRKILATFVGVFFIGGLLYAAVENIKVSGGIIVNAISEDLSCGSTGLLRIGPITSPDGVVSATVMTESPDKSNYFTLQAFVQFDADLTENVYATVRLLNETDWGRGDSDTDVDLDQAYITLKEMIYEPLTLIVGRQPLRYGRGFIVGDPDTNRAADSNNFAPVELSLKKSFDAIRAILDYSPWTIDLVYARVDEEEIYQAGDQDLYGINIRYDWSSYNGVTEVYFFAKDKNWYYNYPYAVFGKAGTLSNIRYGTDYQNKDNKVYCVGIRGQADPTDNWTVWGEAAFQFGNADYTQFHADQTRFVTDNREAWAVQAGAEYRFNNAYNARLGLCYTFLSGDDENSDEFEEWDPMFEDQTPATIMNILFPMTNAHCVIVYGSMMPREDITLWGRYTFLTLAEKMNIYDGYPNPNDLNITYIASMRNTDTTYAYRINNNESYLGSEVDLGLNYDYTEDVQISLSSAVFIPGDWFSSDNDEVAYQLKAGMRVLF